MVSRSPDQLELLPGVAEAIRELNHHGWRAILVTNQPVVAKGFCTEARRAARPTTNWKLCSDANTPFSTAFIGARTIRKKVFPASGSI